jgi:carbon storage regulator
MLVLSRKMDQTIMIGDHIVVRVVKIRGNVVSLGIEAPNNIKIMREELLAKDTANKSDPGCQPINTVPLSAFNTAS